MLHAGRSRNERRDLVVIAGCTTEVAWAADQVARFNTPAAQYPIPIGRGYNSIPPSA